jgi:hypothetical protein
MTGMTFLRRDEALFLLLWSSGYIGAKLGVPLAGTFTLLFWQEALTAGLLVTSAGFWLMARGASRVVATP